MHPIRLVLVLGLAGFAGALASCDKGSKTPQPPLVGGAYDPCADKACGESCSLCAPDDADCVETAEVKTCSADGECSGLVTECP